ncbi:nucleoid occlusion protein [Priestia endophytica]|jgi:ParB family chromosome partitioning protein|uniref:Nucleoid occlusion protein n=2 Tax=Priestia endophytica TaxID=135735 RepID=A0AAX1Q4G7_9BACI|nr:nucleoid occlusion protein [Priestia endophytica]KYG28688.1 nucleoid occlusion protein [Priestia endophytica]MBG9811991.1 chromosome partitioning protein ParB [Priestia endophytica]MCM3540452.1 nucleoid occlusion protein [Priestia endophytica]RAS72932.1 nucleoid occlusion protein [Priestia endophytica]RAS74922.1 nucleoid occlusion protein [Priestia endophytica]
MKSAFSRFFNLKDKPEEHEIDIEEKEIRDEVKELPVSQISPNRYQPRTIFQENKIEELAQTIRTHGIIQPIIVRKMTEGHFEIIAGERRWRAVQSLGWLTIPAIVKQFNDTETASVALIENLQREELTPIEEAVAYAKLIELHNLTQEALAQRLGKGQSTIANKLRLLKLPEEVQDSIRQKLITERHARALISLKIPQKQVELLHEIIEKNLNVKQTEDRIVQLLDGTKRKAKPKRKAFSKDTRIAMNTIRQSLTMVQDSGITLNSEEEEFDDYYQFTIRIPKK